MKKLILSSLVLFISLSLPSCYDDLGGNDYESEMPDVVMYLPKGAYSVMKGLTLNIDPVVESEIPESDLKFTWQVCGALTNDRGRNYFSDLAEGKVLNWVGDLTDAVAEMNTVYQIRLKAEQISTGRKFYSNQSKFTLAGMNGLLLLYGNDQYSEMGLLKAAEFTPASSDLPESPSVVTGVYEGKTGKKLTGKAIQVGQVIIRYIEYYGPEKKALCRVFAITDKEGAWLDKDEMTYYGDWSSHFRNPEELSYPKAVDFVGQAQVAYDGDNMYVATFDAAFPWGEAEFTPSLETNGYRYTFAPIIEEAAGYGNCAGLGYATSINGDASHKGFVTFTNSYYYAHNSFSDYAYLLDTRDDAVIFNPSNMQADLVTMKFHVDDILLAVMKGDASHPAFAGKYFLAEMFPNAESDGDSGFANVPKNLYDLSSCPDIDDAKFFTIGGNSTQNYYAANNTVYQFVADEGAIQGIRKLSNNKGAEVEIEGEITCMKYLDESLATTHNQEPILVVCTMVDGKARLYAFHITEMTGTVASYEIYDSSNIEDWDIAEPIRDFGMKVL